MGKSGRKELRPLGEGWLHSPLHRPAGTPGTHHLAAPWSPPGVVWCQAAQTKAALSSLHCHPPGQPSPWQLKPQLDIIQESLSCSFRPNFCSSNLFLHSHYPVSPPQAQNMTICPVSKCQLQSGHSLGPGSPTNTQHSRNPLILRTLLL